MSFPCIQAGRDFRPERHLPFLLGEQRYGWIRHEDAALLQRWPQVFELTGAAVRLAPALDSPERRSQALDGVVRALADAGRIRGWRNERYTVRRGFDEAPLALIERAAARFFGTLTFGVHANGIAAAADAAPRLWIARRSLNKTIDPGLFDNVVGGGIAWGYGITETLVKECWEESGIAAPLATRATPGRTLHLLAEIPEGVQWEQIFVHDLPLPGDFVPSAQDGEVSEHRLVTIGEALALIESEQMTIDAGLVTLDWLLRSGRIDPKLPQLAGIGALFEPPPEAARQERPGSGAPR